METEIKPEKMWAIWNKEIGFYIGTWLTRAEAKYYHAQKTTQNGNWEFCKKRGDVVMRVQISAAQPIPFGGSTSPIGATNEKI